MDKKTEKFKNKLYKKLLSDFKKHFKEEGMDMQTASKFIESEKFKEALKKEMKHMVKNCSSCEGKQLDIYIQSASKIFISFLKKQFDEGEER